jgi:hypothetical protein
MAIARLNGMANINAMAVDTRVPKILLKAPNSSVTGFHASETRNLNPNSAMESLLYRYSSKKKPAMNTRINAAAQTVRE